MSKIKVLGLFFTFVPITADNLDQERSMRQQLPGRLKNKQGKATGTEMDKVRHRCKGTILNIYGFVVKQEHLRKSLKLIKVGVILN